MPLQAIGFGMGSDTDLVCILLIATAIYAIETIFSALRLHYFRYSPLEWVWRMLTYGKFELVFSK